MGGGGSWTWRDRGSRSERYRNHTLTAFRGIHTDRPALLIQHAPDRSFIRPIHYSSHLYQGCLYMTETNSVFSNVLMIRNDAQTSELRLTKCHAERLLQYAWLSALKPTVTPYSHGTVPVIFASEVRCYPASWYSTVVSPGPHGLLKHGHLCS